MVGSSQLLYLSLVEETPPLHHMNRLGRRIMCQLIILDVSRPFFGDLLEPTYVGSVAASIAHRKTEMVFMDSTHVIAVLCIPIKGQLEIIEAVEIKEKCALLPYTHTLSLFLCLSFTHRHMHIFLFNDI